MVHPRVGMRKTGIRNSLECGTWNSKLHVLIPYSEFHVPHSRDGDHQERKPRFFRIVTIALITAASLLVTVPGSAAFDGGGAAAPAWTSVGQLEPVLYQIPVPSEISLMYLY